MKWRQRIVEQLYDTKTTLQLIDQGETGPIYYR
jgi:hypothetical protein